MGTDGPHRDPLAEYRRASEVYQQWFDLWCRSGDPKHRHLARACLAIAREKQENLKFHLLANKHRARRLCDKVRERRTRRST
jgi:hypothetical protein